MERQRRRPLLLSTIVFLMSSPVASCGDDAIECVGGCSNGMSCVDGVCLSDCPVGCGFNEVCAGDGLCQVDSGIPVEQPAACQDVDGCVTRLWAGQRSNCAMLVDDTVWCWGSDALGQLGLGDDVDGDQHRPVQLTGLPSPPVAMGFGDGRSCAALEDGRVACWGLSSRPLSGGPESPEVVPELTGAIDVDVGDSHACAVVADGAVFCWGDNSHGQLGLGDTTRRDDPVELANPDDALGVALGDHFTCVHRRGGALSCWGENDTGQVGDSTRSERHVPTLVLDDGVVDVAAASNQACILMDDGTVRCWGESLVTRVTTQIDFDGGSTDIDVEYNPLEDTLSPAQVLGVSGATAIAVGFGHQCAVIPNGVVACWGINNLGQLGNRSSDEVRLVPARSASGASDAVALGDWHSCAAQVVGGIACWGSNLNGQLGDGRSDDRQEPAFVRW